jgi:hypothetical protein
MVNEPTGNPDPNVTEQLCVVRLSEHDKDGSPLPSDTVTDPSGEKSTESTASTTNIVHVTGWPAVAEPSPKPALEHCIAVSVARNVTATVVEPELGHTPLCPGYDALTVNPDRTLGPVGAAVEHCPPLSLHVSTPGLTVTTPVGAGAPPGTVTVTVQSTTPSTPAEAGQATDVELLTLTATTSWALLEANSVLLPG